MTTPIKSAMLLGESLKGSLVCEYHNIENVHLYAVDCGGDGARIIGLRVGWSFKEDNKPVATLFKGAKLCTRPAVYEHPEVADYHLCLPEYNGDDKSRYPKYWGCKCHVHVYDLTSCDRE